MDFLSREQLRELGLGCFGENVLISTKAAIYNPGKIFIGSNVRIDAFSILSAGKEGIFLGNNVHLACYVSLMGAEKIEIGDFSGISGRTSIYSSNDDYSGISLTGPTLPLEFRLLKNAPVIIGKHVIVGVGSVVLPGVSMEDGVSIGAMTLVNKSCNAWGVYVGVPAKWIKERHRTLLELEKQYKNSSNV